MQVKTTRNYHFTTVTMAIIKKSTNTKCCRQCGEIRILLNCSWECTLVTATIKGSIEIPIKLKRELPYVPAVPHGGVFPKKSMIEEDMHPTVDCTTIYNSQDKNNQNTHI